MNEQAARQEQDNRAIRRERVDALNDGIGHRPIRRPANDEISKGSPWAMAPWPTLEIAKWAADCRDRWMPGRGNRDVIRAAGSEPQAQLTAVTHQCVMPALRRVQAELSAEGYGVCLEHEAMRVTLRASGFNGREITYAVEGWIFNAPVFSLADLEPEGGGERYPRIRIESRGTAREHTLRECSEAAVYRDALHELRNQMLY